MKRVALLLAALLALPLTAAPDPSDEINAANVVRTMNRYRAADGLPPLVLEPRLTEAAQDRMKHMEETGFWAHESPDGVSPFVWLRVRAYPFRAAGENLASGFETVKVLVGSWMESPGHRANIMSPEYTECGIAVIDGAVTGRATGRSIVVLFASQR